MKKTVTKLTNEQRKNRKEMADISKKFDHERGKDRIKFNNVGTDSHYRSFVIFDDTQVTEGGWFYGRKWMTAEFINEQVNKWIKSAYKAGEDEPDYDYNNRWIPHQCGGCRWFADFDGDYGLCFNVKSPNEGHITFEHAGCKEHSDYDETNKA